jgi:hypothetical protein
LKNLGNTKLDSITIRSFNPFISIDIEKDRIWLYIGEDDPVSVGIFEKIKKYLQKKKQILSWLKSVFTIGMLLGFSLTLFFSGIISGNYRYSLIGLIGILGVIGIIFLVGKSEIYLINKCEKDSFLKRNAEKFLIGTISAALGGIITYLFINNLISK